MLQYRITNPNIFDNIFTISCQLEYNRTTDEIIQQSKLNYQQIQNLYRLLIIISMFSLSTCTNCSKSSSLLFYPFSPWFLSPILWTLHPYFFCHIPYHFNYNIPRNKKQYFAKKRAVFSWFLPFFMPYCIALGEAGEEALEGNALRI